MTPSPEHARLLASLRELRERTGLSLAGLAARTAYSKSSWERYFNGRTLPPRAAVRELCRLSGEPDGRCLALWEIAESAWSGRGKEAPRRDTPSTPPPPDPRPAPEPPEAPEPPRTARSGHRTTVLVAVLACVCAVAVGGVVVVLLLLPHGRDRPASSASPSPATTGPHCRESACEGKSPMAMFCARRPETLARHRVAGGAWVELRYSKECGTSWARTWGTRIGDRIEVSPAGRGGRARGARIRNGTDADSFVYTPMLVTRPGTVVQACFRTATAVREECVRGRAG
ncbi:MULTISPECIES: helix-turn-helix domain-containing protein [unclassified Streptomyces]|jgi:U5 snRNP spliceosome subunit|uniref:helix-turn-helix domain-containing protein n=1 Tax=unclassified Streptomyces TaxID=2593676 RepID=UPI002E266AA4